MTCTSVLRTTLLEMMKFEMYIVSAIFKLENYFAVELIFKVRIFLGICSNESHRRQSLC